MVRNDISNPRIQLKNADHLPAGTGVDGPMPVGEYLYVKWRIRSTGQVIEDRVDLRKRLPDDMKFQKLTFVIDGTQLYVYVVTNQGKRYRGEPPILKTWLSETRKAYEIYPSLNRLQN